MNPFGATPPDAAGQRGFDTAQKARDAAVTAGGDWNHSKANAGTRRTDQPQEPKHRWEKVLQK